DDVRVGVESYLGELNDADLAKALGSRANARAFKDGADPIQLVNSYRSGVQTAQRYDGTIKYTLEGTTRRGLAYRAMSAAGVTGGSARRRVGDRYLAARNVRLMPEPIYARAKSRDEALQMLRDYGWIRPAQPGFTVRGGQFARTRWHRPPRPQGLGDLAQGETQGDPLMFTLEQARDRMRRTMQMADTTEAGAGPANAAATIAALEALDGDTAPAADPAPVTPDPTPSDDDDED